MLLIYGYAIWRVNNCEKDERKAFMSVSFRVGGDSSGSIGHFNTVSIFRYLLVEDEHKNYYTYTFALSVRLVERWCTRWVTNSSKFFQQEDCCKESWIATNFMKGAKVVSTAWLEFNIASSFRRTSIDNSSTRDKICKYFLVLYNSSIFTVYLFNMVNNSSDFSWWLFKSSKVRCICLCMLDIVSAIAEISLLFCLANCVVSFSICFIYLH